MPSDDIGRTRATQVVVGLAAGVAIAAVDNAAFAGEVSPIVIVAMLFVATGTAGAVWGRRAWAAALSTWVCVPSAHAIKHLLGLPDTLHPDTYASIFKLAAFSLAVAILSVACGVFVQGLMAAAVSSGAKRA